MARLATKVILMLPLITKPLSYTLVTMDMDCPVETERELVSARVQVLENGVELLQLVPVRIISQFRHGLRKENFVCLIFG